MFYPLLIKKILGKFKYPKKVLILDMYKEKSWDLSVIKPKSVKIAFGEIERQASLLEAKRKGLATLTTAQFVALIKDLEALKAESSKLGCYAGLLFAENSANQEAQALKSQVEHFLTKVNNRLLFLDLWFKKLPEKKAQAFIRESEKYHYYLESIRRTRRYTLSEKEERIINLKDITGVSALVNIYDLLTSQFEYDFKGKKVTQNQLVVAVRDSNPEIRKTAYVTLLSKYKQHKDALGEIYKNIINDWREENIGLRGYKSPIGVRNVVNDIPDQAVEALLKVCEKNQSLFHRFFEIKRKKLGLAKLRRFDLYAPVKDKKEAKYKYDEAVNLVIDTYGRFSSVFQKNALKIINGDHIHSQLQKNKNTGAFCCGITTKIPPYVLLNYTGTLRDVSTLAHELGHGVHQVLASCQTEFTHDACLPLAETASIFAEMLLSERLAAKDPAKAKELLFNKLEEIYASIIRQAGFVAFEKKAHQMMAEGKTIEEMGQVYLADLKKQLGSKVEIDDLFAYEWAYIPHIFHTPFYCYAYAFGNLLTLALYETYKEKGEAFVPKIIELLSKGGSESPVEITKAVGVNICSEEFWQKGFDVIEGMINRLEE